MKKLKDGKLSIVTAVLLFVMAVGVASVCFMPERTVLISGKSAVEPVYNGNRNANYVSLMINVYDGGDIVKKMLEVLDEKNAKATFFVGGCWADDNEDIIVEILAKGHEIGNHGYFHKDHSKLDENGNREEINSNTMLVKRIAGYEMNLFAPPSGAFSVTTLKVAEQLGYTTVMWSKDTIDWRDKDENLVVKRATGNIASGDLVLMHPKEHTLRALPSILDYYGKIGLKAVTVSECLNDKR